MKVRSGRVGYPSSGMLVKECIEDLQLPIV